MACRKNVMFVVTICLLISGVCASKSADGDLVLSNKPVHGQQPLFLKPKEDVLYRPSYSIPRRMGTFTLGAAEFCWGGAGLIYNGFIIAHATGLYESKYIVHDFFDRGPIHKTNYVALAASTCAYLRCFVGGACNTYNACAPTGRLITKQADTWLWIGMAELGLAALGGAVEISLRTTNQNSISSGWILLGMFGTYDVVRAVGEKNRGISIARF